MVTVYTLQFYTSSITSHLGSPSTCSPYMDLGKHPPSEVYKDHSDLSLKLIDFGFAKAFTEARGVAENT